MNGEKLRPSPALIVAMVALVAAMSGAAVALPGKNTVNSGDIKDATVKSKDLKPDAVRSKHVKGKALKGSDVQDDALKGKQIFEDKLEAVPEAKTVQTVTPFGDSFERATATEGATEAAAQAAAPKVALASRGPLSIYGKCFRDTVTDQLFGEIYIESTEAGAIFDSAGGDLKQGGVAAADFLDPGTPEEDRELATETVIGDRGGVRPDQQRRLARDDARRHRRHRDLRGRDQERQPRRRQRRLRRGQRLPVRRRRARLNRPR